MTPTDFKEKLKELIGNDMKLRPFVCDGNPLACEAFIVGFNPATDSERGFLEFWEEPTGFDRKSWLENYIVERMTAPLKLGKTRRQRLSNTRQRLEWIVASAKPTNVLETNLFSRPSSDEKSLAKENRVTDIFDFLVQTIQPKAILLHGKEAKEYFEKCIGEKLSSERFMPIEYQGSVINLMAVSHFSRGWSLKNSVALGKQLAEACTSNA